VRYPVRVLALGIALIACFVPRSWSQNLYATSEAAQQLVEVNMATGAVTVLFNTISTPDSLIIDNKGRIIYTTQKIGTVSIFDPSTGTNSVIASGLAYPRDLIFDPGATSILVSNYNVGAIVRINLVTGTMTTLLAKQGTVDGLTYDPQGHLFAVVNHHTQVVQLDPNSGAILKTLTVVTNHTIPYYGLDGLTYDSYTGQLWATDVGVGANCLVEIPTDLSDFKFFQVGNMATPDGVISDGKGNLYVGVNLARIYTYNIATDTITKQVKVKNVDDVAMVPSGTTIRPKPLPPTGNVKYIPVPAPDAVRSDSRLASVSR
jgi:streptogramin lyase